MQRSNYEYLVTDKIVKIYVILSQNICNFKENTKIKMPNNNWTKYCNI